MRGMRALPLIALCLACLVSAETQVIPPAQRRGLRVWDHGLGGFRPGPNGNLTFGYYARFKNETPNEIGTITVRVTAMEGVRRTFESKPIVIDRFINLGVAHAGSLLPYEKSEIDASLRFEMPSDRWRSDTGFLLEILSVTGFRKPSLHDAGHLYTFLQNSPPSVSLAALMKDASLMKVRNAQGLTTTLMSFACCDPSVIRYALAHGGSAKERTERGATAMHMAAMNGYAGALDLARSLGGDPNAQTASGRTPLMKAVSIGQSRGWTWLLAHGARPDLMGGDGRSAPLYAIQEGQVEPWPRWFGQERTQGFAPPTVVVGSRPGLRIRSCSTRSPSTDSRSTIVIRKPG